MYLGPPCYGYALNCHFVDLVNTRDTSVMNEKAKLVCFIYMQTQKMKFKFVQINMKQVSYKPQELVTNFFMKKWACVSFNIDKDCNASC